MFDFLGSIGGGVAAVGGGIAVVVGGATWVFSKVRKFQKVAKEFKDVYVAVQAARADDEIDLDEAKEIIKQVSEFFVALAEAFKEKVK